MKRTLLTGCIILLWSVLFANAELTKGNLHLTISKYTGEVSLYYRLPSNNLVSKRPDKYISLLTGKSQTGGLTSYALIDNNVYKLGRNGSVDIDINVTDSEAIVSFTVEERIKIDFDFTIGTNTSGFGEDVLLIKIHMTNLDTVAHIVGIKSVFDTWLGEASGRHFSTEFYNILNTEYYFTDMKRDKWIESANDDYRLRIVFPPESTGLQTVSLANINFLDVPVWAPPLKVGRAFDSLYSYNNSAVSTTWRPILLEADETSLFAFQVEAVETRIVEQGKLSVSDGSYPPLLDIEKYKDANLQNLEYIKALIRQIKELEKNPDAATKEKIIRLNGEIDLILKKLE